MKYLRISAILLVILLVLTTGVAAAGSDELLENGGLETPASDTVLPDGWQAVGLKTTGYAESTRGVNYLLVNDSAVAFEGDYCFKQTTLDSTEKMRMYLYKSVAGIKAGKKYVATAYVKITGAQASARFFVTQGNYDGGIYPIYTNTLNDTAGVWHKIELPFTYTDPVKINATETQPATGTVGLSCAMAGVGTVLWDNLSLREVTDGNLISNGSMQEIAVSGDAQFVPRTWAGADVTRTFRGTHYDWVYEEDGNTALKLIAHANPQKAMAISYGAPIAANTPLKLSFRMKVLPYEASLKPESGILALTVVANVNVLYMQAQVPADRTNEWIDATIYFTSATDLTALAIRACPIVGIDTLVDDFSLTVDAGAELGMTKTLGSAKIADAQLAKGYWYTRTAEKEGSFSKTDEIKTFIHAVGTTEAPLAYTAFAAIYSVNDAGQRSIESISPIATQSATANINEEIELPKLASYGTDKTYTVETFCWGKTAGLKSIAKKSVIPIA